MPQSFLELVASSKASSWTLTTGGAIAYFVESRRAFKLLECFFARAEALRESLPQIGVGVADEHLAGQFGWFGRLKKNFKVSAQTEQCALAGIQGEQNYRSICKKYEIAA